MPHRSFYFNPKGKGLEVFLGPTESLLMEIAWDKGEISVKKAIYYLGNKNKLAYTTVMTVLSRLADKKILKKRKSGRSYIYQPAISKEDFLKEKIKSVKDSLKKNFNK